MLQKQPLNINFSQGLNLKTDSKQVTMGQFLSLENSIFDTGGLLQKRNGFAALTALPDSTYLYLTTLDDGLVAIGNTLSSYSQSINKWVTKGGLQTASLSTLPLVRSSTNQSNADAAVAPNGLVCTAYIDVLSSGPVTKYTIADSQTGQTVVPPTTLPAVGGGVTNGPAKVFVMGTFFVVVFEALVGGSNQLHYIALTLDNPTVTFSTGTLVTSYNNPTPNLIAWDGVVGSTGLYVAYNTTSGGQSISLVILPSNFSGIQGPILVSSGSIADIISTSYDIPTEYVYIAAFHGTMVSGYIVNPIGLPVASPHSWIDLSTFTGSCVNLTGAVVDNQWIGYADLSNPYTWGPADHYIITGAFNYSTSAISGARVFMRSVGLASKAVVLKTITLLTGGNETMSVAAADELLLASPPQATLVSSKFYFLVTYGSTLQPTYFLVDASAGIISRFAYQNGGGFQTNGLPNVSVAGSTLQIAYLRKDLIAAQAKPTPTPSGVQLSSVYSQTGVNIVSITINPPSIDSASIADTLNISGGFLWSYDGLTVAEQGFHVYPDNINATPSGSGGTINAGTYYYQVTYEWTDNNGNVIRSAPSIPFGPVTTTGSTSSIVIDVPTLRLTQKTNVRIVVYRWSAGQEVYYAITSPSAAPVLNNPGVDFMVITDTSPDTAILGNPILYTTGGVIENIAGPATNIITLFNNRLFLLDAEDTNLLWYSKQVIEATPVEMSDLLTIYAAPTTGAQGSTGPITALAPLDDKLIVFKKDAIYYISGIGPDNTGANSQYSDATFISAAVGCTDQNSIVFIPSGLLFQSDKGIWLLGRDLSTSYIGAPVESLTQSDIVKTAISIPGTNQVRFTMASGLTLMYDYYFNQWGTFTGIPGISSTLYTALHTYINKSGALFQELPGTYLDNSTPVLMQFTTGWANLAGLQGYERFYQMLLLGQYITPFQLDLTIAYNYHSNNTQLIVIKPDNFSPAWGGDALWGDATPWGGPTHTFNARIFPQLQKCESFQISIQERYDSSFGVPAGAGLSMSGINLVVGAKKGYRVQSSGKSFG